MKLLGLYLILVLIQLNRAYILYENKKIQKIDKKEKIADVLSLLKYNMGQFKSEISESEIKLYEQFGTDQKSNSTLILDLNPNLQQQALASFSCNYDQSEKNKIQSIISQIDQETEVEFCRLYALIHMKTNSIIIYNSNKLSLNFLQNPQQVLQNIHQFLQIITQQSFQVLILNDQDITQIRMLEQTSSSASELVIDPTNFQIYVWTPLFLAFVLFFAVLAMCSMDFSSDTILYAKFITADKN